MKKHNHYYRDIAHLKKIDIYRFCELYDVTGPLEHALKKIACAGERGVKDTIKDLGEAIDSINRKIEMIHEDSLKPTGYIEGVASSESNER